MPNPVFALIPSLGPDTRDAGKGFLGKLVLAARQRVRYQHALRRLDDRDLDDINVARGDFPELAWRHATGAEPLVRSNALLAYQVHEGTLASPRWRALEAKGARPQRPLWASTGVKDPAYEDTRYVVGLALPGTVNTMPAATLDATADHGRLPTDEPPRAERYRDARTVVDELREIGIDLGEVAGKLEAQGVASFEKSWDELVATVTDQLEQAGAEVMPAGAVKPAGGEGAGPAAAAPRATSR